MQTPLATLQHELAHERAATLGRLGRRLEASLAALKSFDTERDQAISSADRELRAAIVSEAAIALWHFVVHGEACGFNSNTVMRDYSVPGEVQAQMGIVVDVADPARRKLATSAIRFRTWGSR
jgi:hypothetical protein